MRRGVNADLCTAVKDLCVQVGTIVPYSPLTETVFCPGACVEQRLKSGSIALCATDDIPPSLRASVPLSVSCGYLTDVDASDLLVRPYESLSEALRLMCRDQIEVDTMATASRLVSLTRTA